MKTKITQVKKPENTSQFSEKISASPVIKWAGGKRQLLPELRRRLPSSYNRYFEPFIGGGALYFDIAPLDAYISDINPELVNLYEVIRDDVEALISDLSSHENSLEYYNEIRALDRNPNYTNISPVRKASRFIYLNKTCFNGLYRVNRKGFFNVPFGRYANPNFLNKESLYVASEVLQTAQIECASFENILNFVKKGDFVYFDPPYIPLSQTASFTSYSKEDFGMDKQVQLKSLCDKLSAMGVNFILSNSDTPISNDLYSEYNVEKIYASRSINSKADGRGKIAEIIVRNY